MQKQIREVKRKLKLSITQLDRNKHEYVHRPGKDFSRNRKVNFKDVINTFLCLSGKSMGNELLDVLPEKHQVSVSAFMQQRNKLKANTFRKLLTTFNSKLDCLKLHKGYRLIAVDGTKINISHDPNDLDTYFKDGNKLKGHNQLHLNALYDLTNGIYLDGVIQEGRKKNEHSALVEMVKDSNLPNKTILIADRGYESYNNFAHLNEKNWKYLIRVKAPESKSILSTLELPEQSEFDIATEFTFTKKQAKAIREKKYKYKILQSKAKFDFIDAENPFFTLAFRVVKFVIPNGTAQCFITNLDKDEFDLKAIKDLYLQRWGIETSFRTYKHNLGATYLHAKKTDNISHEIYAKLVMYNFCSITTSLVNLQKTLTKHTYKVNFSRAINICVKFFKKRKNCLFSIENLLKMEASPNRTGRSSPRDKTKRSNKGFSHRLS